MHMSDEAPIRVRIVDKVWLSACARCRQVIALGESVESLHAQEQAHQCDDEPKREAAEADVA